MNQNIIPSQITNSPIFHKTFKINSNSNRNSMIMNIHGINHQQQHLITTPTTINHEFINNLQQQYHSSSILSKTQGIHVYMS